MAGETNGHAPDLAALLGPDADMAGDDAGSSAALTGGIDTAAEPALTGGAGVVDSSAAEPEVADARSFALRDQFRGRGYEIPDEIDDDSLMAQLETWAAQAERAKAIPEDVDPRELVQYADIGRSVAPYREQFEQWRQSLQQQQVATPTTQAAPVAQAAAQPAAPTSTGPDSNTIAMWRQVCDFDEQAQMFKPKAIGFEAAAKGLNELAMQRRQNFERFGEDPDGFLRSRYEPVIQKEVEKRLSEFQQQIMPDLEEWRQYRLAQQQQQFIAPFEQELIIRKPDGNIESLTPKGQAFNAAYEQAPATLSPLQRLQYAKMAADSWEFQQSKQPAPQKPAAGFTLKKAAPAATPAAAAPQSPAPDKRQAFVDKGRHREASGRFLPDRAGTVVASDRTGRPQGGRVPTLAELYAAAKAGVPN